MFSPEGTQVLYAVKIDSTSTVDLHLIGADGSGDSQITDVGLRNVASIGAFSADGTKVYFFSKTLSDGNIYSVNTDGLGLTNISGGTTDQWYKMLALFPEGTKILYLFGHDPSVTVPIYDLYVMNADGTSRLGLTSSSLSEMVVKAFLSPDGSLVAYGFGDTTTLANLYLTGSDGSSNTKITSLAPLQSLINALWSPDGDKLVYSYGNIVSSGVFNKGKIVLINSDGSGAVDVANSAVGDAWLGDWW
jgi:Tol biopolymer transport system component